jgi:hypothetical protein
MPVEITPDPTLSPAAGEGVHDAFITQRLPGWLTSATSAQRELYFRALHRQASAVDAVTPLFAGAGGIIDFAASRLSQALQQRFGMELDVHKVELTRFEAVQTFPVQRDRVHRQTLLHAALANFSDAEAQQGVWEARGWIARVGATSATQAQPAQAQQQVLQVKKEDILPVSVEAFVDCCRNLNIGALYQAHLRDTFAMHDREAPAAQAMTEHVVARLHVQVHAAWLQKAIDADAWQMLVAMLDNPQQPLTWAGHGAQLCWLEMLGSLFHTAHLLSGAFVLQRGDGKACIAYLPSDKLQPLKQYANLQALADALRERLRDGDYRRSFMGMVSARRVQVFESRLLDTLNPGRGSAGRAPAEPLADIGLNAVPIDQPLAELLHFQAMVKIAEDARFHAVPAADCDQKSRDERLARWRGLGIDVLNVVGLFIPAVGAVMGVYGAISLLEEVFEGVDDWKHGQTKAAISHLEAVVEALATGVALAKLPHADFIDALVPVAVKGKPQRLWRPDVWGYRSSLKLPASSVPDALGVLRHEGQAFIRMNELLYAVDEPAPGSSQWHLKPPRPGGYAVPLEHNGQGAWRHVQENPLGWENIELVTRWGHRLDGYSHFVLNDLRGISGISDGRLRQALFRHEPMPALLADVLDRYDLENADGEGAVQPLSQRYAAAELAAPWSTAGAAPLRGSFPGLPTRVVEELAANATDAERTLLKAGRVPLRLAEQARVQLREVRVVRALEALYYDRQDQPDCVRLALGMLPLTEGWPQDVAVELRADSLSGTLLLRAGAPVGQPYTLVATSRGFTVHGPANDVLRESQDLFVALYAVVREAVPATPVDAGPRTLRSRLLEAALGNRQQLPEVLGMKRLQRAFVLPERQLDGRLGYPLSGRRVASWQTGERLRRLYPGASELELRRLRHDLGLHPLAASRILRELELEWQVLHVSLQSWVQVPATFVDAEGVEQAVSARSRQRAVTLIEAAWRRESTHYDLLRRNDYADGYSLDLSGLHIGPLPAMTARFNHIRSLRLENMHMSQDPSAFLVLFGGVRRLTLYNNRLQRVPEQIGRLGHLVHLDLGRNAIEASPTVFAALRAHPSLRGISLDSAVAGLPETALADLATITRLEHADLARNALQLTAEGWQHLGSLVHLRSLDLGYNQITLTEQTTPHLNLLIELRDLRLNNNPLLHAPSLRELGALEILNLADCQIDEWPHGLSALMNRTGRVSLRRIDLSRNNIVDVPSVQYTNFVRARSWLLGRVTHRFTINGNPLSAVSIRNLRVANLEARSTALHLGNWLLDCPPALRERIEQSRLDTQTEGFYLAMTRVAETADYRVDPLGTRERMWAVAEAITEPLAHEVPVGWTDLRRHIFLLAEDATETCGDGISLLLNQFETSIHLWQTASEDIPQNVVLECERMFRLALVDDCAVRITQRRLNRRLALAAVPMEQPLPELDPMDLISDFDLGISVDEAEIRLVMRRQMALRLRLPAQPQNVLYTEVVHEVTLQRVQQYIETEATFEALRTWLQDEVSWQFYMERTQAEQLEAFDQAWGFASIFFEEVTSADGPLPSVEGVPPAAFEALQGAAPQLRWRDAQGAALRVQVNSGEYNALYQALASARNAARRALLEQNGDRLLDEYCELPRQPLPK